MQSFTSIKVCLWAEPTQKSHCCYPNEWREKKKLNKTEATKSTTPTTMQNNSLNKIKLHRLQFHRNLLHFILQTFTWEKSWNDYCHCQSSLVIVGFYCTKQAFVCKFARWGSTKQVNKNVCCLVYLCELFINRRQLNSSEDIVSENFEMMKRFFFPNFSDFNHF